MSFDCRTCLGASRLEERDCAECGGTGWRPPPRDPDRLCIGCGRGLWIGTRGPKWYAHRLDEKAIEPHCYFCLADLVEGRRGPTIPRSEFNPINLGDTPEGHGDESS